MCLQAPAFVRMNLWDTLLAKIQKKISHQNFDTWFKPLLYLGESEGKLLVQVPNGHFRSWHLENYERIMRRSLDEIGVPGDIQFVLPDETQMNSSATEISSPVQPPGEPVNLNCKYTFESFVVGFSNQFAHAAALAIAEQPSKAYNPLFIYGGVGLGKTHLMHAIGHCILKKYPRTKLTYMSSERFMNELINSIRYDRTIQFRDKYRNIDVLLMDDIQFLAGKERTQEEFFHTFNALYDAQKQIVISSDCPPKEIPTLEERLHSRFEWGLIADIQPPDLETKIAILRRKAEMEGVVLPDDVAFFIASNIKSNIRELEGSLVRLIAYSSLTGMDIELSLAQEVLKNIVGDTQRAISIELIQKTVAEFFNLKVSDLKAKNNSRNIAEPRQIAMYICKELTDCSLPQIGREFGGKHHTTVLHSIRKIDEMRKVDKNINGVINKLVGSIR